MILDGVDVFVKVVQAGSFSAAARQLAMPPTTVSAKIARLEERLGVTLIQRSTRKMHVTAAGEAYYAHCAEALRALETGEEQMLEARSAPSGVLRLTVSPDMAQSVLPGIVQRYLAAYPHVSVELIVTNTQLDLVAEGIDLAVRAGPMKDSTLQSRKFGSASLGLYASRAYLEVHGTPRVPADLDAHEILIHSRFPPNQHISSASGDRVPIRTSTRLRADDIQTLRALAAEGVAIALLPDFPGVGVSPALERVLPDYGTQTGTAFFVYPAGKYTPVNVRAFIDLALKMRP